MSKNYITNPSAESNLKQWLEVTQCTWEASSITEGFYHAIVDVDEKVSLSVEVGGNPENPPLLLVMGLGSQMVFWPDSLLYRLINAGFFVIRFDNRDIGLSSKITPKENTNINALKMMLRMQVGLTNQTEAVAYDLSDMVEDTVKLIRKLNLGKVNLMGASMGGIIAQMLSASYPKVVDKLILLFTTNNRPFLPPPKLRQLQALFKAPKSSSKEDSVVHAQWFIETVGSTGFIDTQQVAKIANLRYERCFYPRGTVQQLHAILATGSIANDSKRISAPTLIIHGEKDGLVPASSGRDIAKFVKNAKFHLIEGMGHDIPEYYQPHIVNLIKEHCYG